MMLRLATLSVLAAVLSSAQPKFGIEGGKLFDFGELYTASPVSRELRITNSGSDTLRLTNVSGSCGCTGTLLSASDIPPGGSGTLNVTFNPAKFRGKVEKSISMNTNDPADPKPHIIFTATITHILDFDQNNLVFTTKPDSEVTTDVAIRNLSDVPIRITGTRSSSSQLVVKLSRTVILPGEQASLICRIRPTKPGIIKGDLTVFTDHPLLPSVDLRFFCYAKHIKKSGRGAAGK